jgi:ATP-dependent protease ClpP protease subunit
MSNKANIQIGNLLKPAQDKVFQHDYGTITDFYLCDEIGPAEDYVEWFQRIRAARDSDILKFHINSPGGDLLTTIQLLQALAESEGRIVMSVEGACMSAATMLFLCGDDYLISEHSIFLFHNYSGGKIGKGGEMYHGIMHERKWTENLLKDVYKNFLTPEEIEHLIEDKDIWMDQKQVIERLENRNKILEEAEKAAEKEAAAAERAAKRAQSRKKTKKE